MKCHSCHQATKGASDKLTIFFSFFSSRKANKSNKQKRILDPSENVYLIQLSWKGAGRFILEDKDKLTNEHGPLSETYSEPLGANAGLSPSLRRHSRFVLTHGILYSRTVNLLKFDCRNLTSKFVKQKLNFQLWLVVFLIPLEVQSHKVPHLKALRHSIYETRRHSCGSSSSICQGIMKLAIYYINRALIKLYRYTL